MGFGSYDESEQENQASGSDIDDSESVDVDATDHDGDVNFETNASQDELLDKLQDMKD
ncbi:conserved hypothetical protein [Halorhabdus utahensis DSM 12940]|uniref:DUF5786 domain-containing protein n=1 Tax=Halorhabdus utahensis (strain DSM 12940 / JCM 11049 / AX-2) TaxID=519442 RepID=C7NQJ9_HALUD|nr:DUF5786 family protein [Halorhabdus utahensis]ACV10458.1 conserved hypothetical protein [Halorhabdus utahensis DSM 12940]